MSGSDCACGHSRDEHGDGFCHTACCFVLHGDPFIMCNCEEYEVSND